MDKNQVPELAENIVGVVRVLLSDLRPKLVNAALTGRRAENENPRHEDNFLSDYDLLMHERYKELLAEFMPSFIYASEESDPEVVGSDANPDLCVLVDPLDTSELAVRALLGYTHIMVYSLSLKRPIVSVVGDIFHSVQLYVGAHYEDGSDRAFAVTADDEWHLLDRPSDVAMNQALVTNYLMRPEERFLPLAEQRQFMEALGAVGEDGKRKGRIGQGHGSVCLAHVAAGFTDATIEIQKGFAAWDFLPGHFILHAAGGVAIDLTGEPIGLDYGFNSLPEINKAMGVKRKFVAAGSRALAEEIRATLRP
ncbi:myo-inositol-1(or 4)-monophosphatase [Kribbella aluminosa]|uniref:Myo-inositol-1(Or 4)-monophosphatase n=1 Tax=Kribbella aluminosa TaxID=416017 RepID=A0ABS4V119_9ACTN|nr:inositol monophosphatase family protein [Kribbella aluminosa]MBP2357597.1 myo-inositol-1(or 4)-monophosphatase [Kribbella aluminosa]